MASYISRDLYLHKLINRRDNGEVKIVTGARRCGKSWLLKKIYRDYLLAQGVNRDNILIVSFDTDDDPDGGDLTDPVTLKKHLYSRITDEENYYIILDEIRVYPLSFSEFCMGRGESVAELWKEYYTYGGMPALRNQRTAEQKVSYLQRLWQKTYIDDVVERGGVRNRNALECLVDSLCSSIGSLTNPNKIRNTLASVQHVKIEDETLASYMQLLENSFLFEGARRYNVKGKRYYESVKKYYAVDVGLRNARLNFRQQEITHIMENVIYNELRIRGYVVDVGVVEKRGMADGKSTYSQYEIDFVASNGVDKYYIQSAYALPNEEKREQELASLKMIDDAFRKIIIVGDDIASYTDENGFLVMGLFQFLRNSDIMS